MATLIATLSRQASGNTREPYYSVSYFDALEGGSGLTKVKVVDLHKWLAEHPGFLIRKLSPDWLED